MRLDIIKNKRVLVVGLGVTGESVVRFLHSNGVSFDVVDEKSTPSASLLQQLRQSDVHTQLNAELCCAYDLLIISPGVPRSLPALQAAIEKDIDIIGDIELFASAVGQTPIIAVTGSNGKSTVVSWIAHVLEACDIPVKLCGNIGTPALDSIDAQAKIYVLELSSYQLESTQSLGATSAAVLNVSDDHMDRYDSIEHYAAVKRTVYKGCQHAVYNQDDNRTWVQSSAVQAGCDVAPHCADFSLLTNKANYHLGDAANDGWLCWSDEPVIPRSELQLPGDHNVANALAVIALLEPFNINRQALRAALGNFNGLEHRTEFVLEHNGVRWYNDSKGTNIDACKKAVTAMQAPVILIAGGIGKGADFAALQGVVEQHVKALVLIGVDAELMHKALSGSTTTFTEASLRDAVQRCVALANEGDVVLLSPACSSFDMFDNFEQRGDKFKQAVREIAA